MTTINPTISPSKQIKALKVHYGVKEEQLENRQKLPFELRKEDVKEEQVKRQDKNKYLILKIKELDEVIKFKDSNLQKLRSFNKALTNQLKQLSTDIDENLKKVIHLPKEDLQKVSQYDFETRKQMTLDLINQELRIKGKEVKHLKSRIKSQINPQKEIELQNAINESQKDNELLSKEIKHLTYTTNHHSNILLKSMPTHEELETYERKIRAIENQIKNEKKKNTEIVTKMQSSEDNCKKIEEQIGKKAIEVNRSEEVLKGWEEKIVQFKIVDQKNIIKPNDTPNMKIIMDLKLEQQQLLLAISGFRSDYDYQYKVKLIKVNELKEQLSQIIKMNNTNLHKINEIMNIIKHSKDQEKRELLSPNLNENISYQKIRKYPRRLYLKKKAETVSSKEKEEIINSDNDLEKGKKSTSNEFKDAKLKKTSQSIQNLKSNNKKEFNNGKIKN